MRSSPVARLSSLRIPSSKHHTNPANGCRNSARFLLPRAAAAAVASRSAMSGVLAQLIAGWTFCYPWPMPASTARRMRCHVMPHDYETVYVCTYYTVAEYIRDSYVHMYIHVYVYSLICVIYTNTCICNCAGMCVHLYMYTACVFSYIHVYTINTSAHICTSTHTL